MSENVENNAVQNMDLFEQRTAKIRDYQEAGINPFGGAFPNVELIEVVRTKELPPEGSELPGPEATVAGRMTAKRGMGKSIFADLRDSTGRLQLFAGKSDMPEEMFALCRKLDIGDIIGVKGNLFVTKTGELTLRVKEVTLLSKSMRPLPEKFHGLVDVEQRYRQRYLDLIANPEVKDVFRKRSAIIREVRNFLADRGFMEVETPMLQPLAGGASATPFETFYGALNSTVYMRIAPELYLKRLLVGGFEKVFELNRSFRNEGLDRRHNPEFTMLEIYQAYSNCEGMMELIESMISTVAMKVCGTLKIDHGNGKVLDFTPPFRRATYHELCKEKGGDDWFDITPAERIERGQKLGLDVNSSMSDLEVTNELYEKLVEPTNIQPTFVTRLPAELLPLANPCADDPTLVDVFELGVNGMELAPAYSELNNPIIQRQRFMDQFEATKEEGDELENKIDEDFLTALEYGMPPAGGMGVGIDRLVMALTGAESIRDVILFPQMKRLK
ncbi:MAG: lysine--tRNA ligase [Lentisphaeria bacterium]|nr:lysine--tRNA ligase [Lentisphaeria bacterium]